MHRHRTSSGISTIAAREPRQSIAIVGLLVTGVMAALTLPIWLAAVCMLLTLVALGIVARPEPALEPVVIRRDNRG